MFALKKKKKKKFIVVHITFDDLLVESWGFTIRHLEMLILKSLFDFCLGL